jgi:hypothetical protein
MIRGKTLDEPNQTTLLFAEYYRTMLHLANCLGKNEEILIENYKQALMSGRIDIEILSKAIGDGDLDMDLVLDH